MQRKIAIFGVTVLVLIAGCSAVPGTTSPAPAGQSPAGEANPADRTNPSANTAPAGSGPERTVVVGASGQVRTAPNQAIVRVAVTARADSVETVRQQLAANASRMRTALREMGVTADRITLVRYDIGRNHRHEERPSAPKFRGQHTIAIRLNDTDRAGPVIVTAVQNGATQVEEVQFTITPATRRELRKRALAKAVTNAREKAAVMARGTGLRLSGVRTVQTAAVSVEPVRQQSFALAAAGDGGGGGIPTSFESGAVTVSARVTVMYNATRR